MRKYGYISAEEAASYISTHSNSFFFFFASLILALRRSLHRFSQYSSISFFPICLCFNRGFISGPFLLFLPLLLPEFLSVDSILSCGGFVSRFLRASYRFPPLSLTSNVAMSEYYDKKYTSPFWLSYIYKKWIVLQWLTKTFTPLLVNVLCCKKKSMFKEFKRKRDGPSTLALGSFNLCWADVVKQG